MREIVDFPKELVKVEGNSKITWVDGLYETFKKCYLDWVLPSELGITWAKAGKPVQRENKTY